jgi:hypothetical protein
MDPKEKPKCSCILPPAGSEALRQRHAVAIKILGDMADPEALAAAEMAVEPCPIHPRGPAS